MQSLKLFPSSSFLIASFLSFYCTTEEVTKKKRKEGRKGGKKGGREGEKGKRKERTNELGLAVHTYNARPGTQR